MEKEELWVSPIFTALTKPAMILGVTLDYLSICFLVALCLFILADNPLFLAAYLPLHFMGWILCKIDPNIFRILIKRAECAYSPNKKFWGCHSYEPF